MQAALELNYPEIPQGLRERYANLLVNRAVRFFIENNLDRSVVDEDLADGASDTEYYSLPEGGKTDLHNLEYGEGEEQRYQDGIVQSLKDSKEK